MTSTRPILITGCPRSGTTWTGNIVGASREVFSVYEPFNDDVGARLHLPQRFMRLTQGNSGAVRRELDDMMALGNLSDRARLALRGVAERWMPGPRRYTPARLAARRLLRHRLDFISPKRVSVKDPIAFFSAEWMAEVYDAQVVVMIRHPCSVAASYLSLGWDSELGAVIDHPLPDGAEVLAEDLRRFRRDGGDTVSELILQWRIFTVQTLDLMQRHPDWIFIVHDDLSMRPRACFEALFARLQLELTPEIEAMIEAQSKGEKKEGQRASVQHDHSRNSRDIVDAWKRKLDPDVAARILDEAGELWDRVQREVAPI